MVYQCAGVCHWDLFGQNMPLSLMNEGMYMVTLYARPLCQVLKQYSFQLCNGW